MSGKRGTPWLSVVLCGMMGGPLAALDKFPTSGCQDRNNLLLLKRCDPYQVRFLRVSEGRIIPPAVRRRNVPSMPLSGTPRYPLNRRMSLDRLVQKYIDYQERMLERRERSRSTPPPAARTGAPKSPGKNIPKSPAKKLPEAPRPTSPESNVSREEAPPPPAPISEEPTLFSLLGERHPEWMLLPQERRIGPSLPTTNPPTSAAKAPAKIVKVPTPPRTVRHRVEAGESFIALARRYRTTPYDIRRWNKLPYDHLLKIGETLLIHPGERTPPEKLREALRRERFGYYTVKKGDTLIGIARRFDVRLREVLELNDLERRSHLKVGQKLMLPLKAEKIAKILAREKRFRFANSGRFRHKLRVVATAYTSHRNQTDKTPFLAAWNNRIRPGMKIIAVSPDLIRKYGITNGTKVKISGLPGIYTVRDKMHRRMRNHIDIYMGTNRRKALRWGRRRVILYW